MSDFISDMLTAQDISVDSRAHLSYIVVRLKRSKSDPFAVGTRVCIGAKNQSVCPVTALLGYLAICPKRSELLFIFQDALHLHPMAAAGRHLIVASAEGQSITYFQHVLLTPCFVSMMLCSGFYLRN